MKKFLKIFGIVIAVIFGISIIAGIIGAIFDDEATKTTTENVEKSTEPKVKDEKAVKSNLDKIMNKIENADDSTTFNSYFNEIEEIAKGNSRDAARADSILKDREFFKFSMQQRQLAKWVEYAKKEFPKQFSDWDGSNKYLVARVKKVMNDPSSFKHVETKFEYGSGYRYIRVRMTYRGKNAFNAVVTENVTAKIDVEGKILEVE